MAGASEEAYTESEPLIGVNVWKPGFPYEGMLSSVGCGGHNRPWWQPGINVSARLGLAGYDSFDEALKGRTADAFEIDGALAVWGAVARDLRLGGGWRAERGRLLALSVSPGARKKGAAALAESPVDPTTDSEWAERLAER